MRSLIVTTLLCCGCLPDPSNLVFACEGAACDDAGVECLDWSDCPNPPPSRCIDVHTVQTFGIGRCENQRCVFTANTVPCRDDLVCGLGQCLSEGAAGGSSGGMVGGGLIGGGSSGGSSGGFIGGGSAGGGSGGGRSGGGGSVGGGSVGGGSVGGGASGGGSSGGLTGGGSVGGGSSGGGSVGGGASGGGSSGGLTGGGSVGGGGSGGGLTGGGSVGGGSSGGRTGGGSSGGGTTVDQCASNLSCDSCTLQLNCGWCNGSCRSGTSSGSNDLVCNRANGSWKWLTTECGSSGGGSAGGGSAGGMACTPRPIPSGTVMNFGAQCSVLTNEAQLLAVGDFTGDGYDDLVTDVRTSTVGGLQLFRNLGTGRFADAGVLPLEVNDGGFGFFPYYDDLVTLDLDSNGLADLVLVDFDGVRVWLASAGGTFRGPTRRTFNPSNLYADRALVGDFNNDCRPDLAVEHPNNQGRISILLSAGDGGFSSITSYKTGSSTASVRDFTIGDFDKDGWLDLAAITYSDTRVLYNQRNGSFLLPDGGTDFVIAGTLSGTAELTTADWNADGVDDVIVSTGTSWYLLAGSTGRTHQQVPLALPFAPAATRLLSSGVDLNSDGKRDAVAFDVGATIRAQWSLIQNGVPGPLRISGGGPSRTGAYQLRVSDFSRDGKPDLAGLTYASGTSVQLCTWSGQ